MSRRLIAVVVALVTGAATGTTGWLTPAVAAGGYSARNDYCLGQCDDILPPGENGNATLVDILGNKSIGTRPAHSADQLDKYANLLYSYAGLSDSQIGAFYDNSSFGVPAGQVESTESPRSDVTIVRDKATGVPHITGTTRSGTMYGAGYAGAEDRLWVMDLMRHLGRGQLTSFAGGAPGNRELEQSLWRNSPYTEADLQAQIAALRAKSTRGAQLYDDVQSYVAGVNAYIAHCMAGRNCPGEYVVTGHLDAITNAGGPQPFQASDLIAIAGVIGGLFGNGGGAEMQSALVRIAARARYGTAVGDQVWQAFREQNDPETVLTLHNGQSFPFGGGSGDAASVVLPDAGSVTQQPIAFDPTGSATTAAGAASGVLPGLSIGAAHQGMSNAVVVSAANSATGHPVAVFGPQTGYFSPQLLMLEELQGPGVSARGIAFAGLNQYVLIGRGQDYSWSATSSLQDLTDTYAVPLCETSGATPTVDSTGYLFRGTCTAMEPLERDNSWSPTTADSTPAGSYKLIAYRTGYGLVSWRGLVGGRPYAFTELRASYRHEADSAIGFQMFNDPAEMGSAAAFQNSASNVAFAFNWFYVDSSQAAYFMSGNNPVRAAGADPGLPQGTGYEWQGWNPGTNTASYTAPATHPNSVDQDYYVSWNNKQAKDYSAADGNFSFGAVHRAQLLDGPVRTAIQSGQKLGRADVVRIAENAASVDLRGQQVLPLLLRVLTSQPLDATTAATVSSLRAWADSGAHRVETAAGSKTYRYADAIRVFDAWWPLLVSAEFSGGLGSGLFQSLVDALQINESPSGGQQGTRSDIPSSANEAQAHKGSSFQYGWWGYVSKDLRAVLGQPVSGPLPVRYCGGGSLSACRQALLGALSQAAAEPAGQVYPADTVCSAGDQWCADAIEQSPLGGITDGLVAWQNRPTFQQVVSFPAHRGDAIANLALGRSATASSTQTLTSYTAAKAVDGDPTTRWSSKSGDNEWLSVDLGSAQSVGRVILNWEAAYGKAYHIDVSTDGGTWTTVWSTAAGDGGTDNDTFPAVSARHVRVVGTGRATGYGYSLWEMEVYAR